MATALSAQIEQPETYEDLSFRERLALLVARGSPERDQSKQKRLLQKARLRLEAPVHDIDNYPDTGGITGKLHQNTQESVIDQIAA